jgi:hypothetical protein
MKMGLKVDGCVCAKKKGGRWKLASRVMGIGYILLCFFPSRAGLDVCGAFFFVVENPFLVFATFYFHPPTTSFSAHGISLFSRFSRSFAKREGAGI